MPFLTVLFSGHAVQRMVARRIDAVAVRDTLDMADVIEIYVDDTPYPSALYLGWVADEPLHVVAADDSAGRRTIVITVYEPHPAKWDATFRSRRAP